MVVLRRVRPGDVGVLQDAERLTGGGAAGAGRRDAVHVVVAVGDVGGLLPGHLVGGEVGRVHPAGARDPAGRRVDRRVLQRLDDVGADRSLVERLGAVPAERAVGRGKVGVAQGGADHREAAAGQEEPAALGEVPEPGLVAGRLVPEGLVDGEALLGDPLGRLQHLAERPAAPQPEGPLPGGGRAGDADGEAAGDGVGEGQRLAVLQEERLVGRPGGRLAAVQGGDPAGRGVVVDEVATTADPGRVRLGDPQRGRRGDGRVHGVAAVAEHLDPGGGRVHVHAGDRPAPADGLGRLDRRSVRLGRPDGGTDQRGGEQQRRGDTDQGSHRTS